MRLLDIAGRAITLELEPEDAFLLARACECTMYELEGSQPAEGDITGNPAVALNVVELDRVAGAMQYGALTALFDAAFAGCFESNVRWRDQAERQKMRLAHMRAGGLLDFKRKEPNQAEG